MQLTPARAYRSGVSVSQPTAKRLSLVAEAAVSWCMTLKPSGAVCASAGTMMTVSPPPRHRPTVPAETLGFSERCVLCGRVIDKPAGIRCGRWLRQDLGSPIAFVQCALGRARRRNRGDHLHFTQGRRAIHCGQQQGPGRATVRPAQDEELEPV